MTASSSRAPLRTVLIGLGRIGFGYHAPAIVAHPGLQLVGVTDPLADRRAEATAKWQVPAFESVEAMLRETRPELVVVASPTPLHREHACAAFAVGAHVLCDKPVARSSAELAEVLAAAKAADRRFMAFHPSRLRPEILALRDLLARGRLGPVHTVKRGNSSYVRRVDWQAFKANGGGMINNYASHQLDEMIALFGAAPAKSVYCVTRTVATLGDAEDFVKILLVNADGLIVDVDITQAAAQPIAPWQVFGAHGSATWDATDKAWRVKYFVPAEAPAIAAQTGLAAANRQYAHEQLPWREWVLSAADYPEPDYYDRVWRHLVHGEPAPVTPEEAQALLKLLERCHASADTGALA